MGVGTTFDVSKAMSTRKMATKSATCNHDGHPKSTLHNYDLRHHQAHP